MLFLHFGIKLWTLVQFGDCGYDLGFEGLWSW